MDNLAQLAVSLTGADGGFAAARQGEQFLCRTYVYKGATLEWAHTWPSPAAGCITESLDIAGELRERFGVQIALSVPVLDAQQVPIGFVQLHKMRGDFAPGDVEAVTALAALASPAMQNALVQRRLREAEESLETLAARMDETAAQQHLLNRLLARQSKLMEGRGTAAAASAEDDLLDYLRRSREQLYTILQGVAEGIIVHESSGRLLHVNAAAVRILGFDSQDQVLGWTISEVLNGIEVMDPDGKPLPGPSFPGLKAAFDLHVSEAILSVRPRGGSDERTLVVRATPVLDEDGHLRFTVSIFTDITDRLRIERLREQFLSMVTHELRSPLAAIKAGVALVREDPPNEPADLLQLLGDIDGQADRLLNLVGNLLDMAQVEAGTFSISPTPSLLHSAIEEAIARLPRPVAARVHITEPLDLPLLEVDVQRVAQVLVNLLTNADKFSTPGTPITLSVSRGSATDAPDGVTTCVTNVGAGIPEAEIPLLFRKFSRIGTNRTGTGLGLAISKHIVEGHGGTIWVDSSPEKQSTTFCFSLPVSQADAPRP
ncbi:MAG: PAS domain-containing sensor histidine kinase [Dehalococcoidia bacterium]